MSILTFIATARAVMIQNLAGTEQGAKFDVNGKHQSLELAELDVSKAKNCIWPVLKGIANDDDTSYNVGMKAIEYTLATWQSQTVYQGNTYPGAAGSFPAQSAGSTSKQHKLHNKLIFLSHAAHAVYLAQLDGRTTYVGSGGTTPLSNLISLLNTTGTWMLASEDLFKFTKLTNTPLTNQLMCAVNFLHFCGTLTANTSMVSYAETLEANIFANRNFASSPGIVFPEKTSGTMFDWGYQTVSLHYAMEVWYSLTAGARRTALMAEIQGGWDKLMPYIGVDGLIDTSDNTRTGPIGARIGPHTNPAGIIAKGLDIDIYPYRLHMMDHVFAGG